MICPWTRPAGVRVDGAWTRPAGVKVHRIQKVQKVQRVVVAATPQFLKSALRDWLYESYSLIRITMMSHLRWLPPLLVPYSTTFPPRYRSGDKRKAPLWAG